MSLKFLAGFLPVSLLSASVWHFSKPLPQAPVADASISRSAPAVVLEDPVREAYAPFEMTQAFVLPAGPKGLEYSAAARALEGRKVRIAGSMVRHLHDDPAVFLLTPQAMALNMAEYGLADDLPPQAVHVILDVLPGKAPEWVRRPLVIYGRLELGPREEADGRISQFRLFADHVTAADGLTVIEPRVPILTQPARVAAGRARPPILSAHTPE